MIQKIGWKTSALVAMALAWMFSIYDDVALESVVYALIATFFLMMTVVCAMIALNKLWISESEKEKRKKSTPVVIRQARPK